MFDKPVKELGFSAAECLRVLRNDGRAFGSEFGAHVSGELRHFEHLAARMSTKSSRAAESCSEQPAASVSAFDF
jgi:hypothetical protein